MSTAVQMILSKYVNELEKIYGTSLKSVILYGSYARGDFSEEIYPFYKNVKSEGVKLFRRL